MRAGHGKKRRARADRSFVDVDVSSRLVSADGTAAIESNREPTGLKGRCYIMRTSDLGEPIPLLVLVLISLHPLLPPAVFPITASSALDAPSCFPHTLLFLFLSSLLVLL
jgi:hypothetical protein